MTQNTCSASSVLAVCFVAACQFTVGCMQQAVAPTTRTFTSKLPVISAQPETKETQEKGGVEISIAPASYTLASKERRTTTRTTPPLLSLKSSRDQQVYVEQVYTSEIGASPNRLKFTVKINNQMPRVFKGAGTIVQFNVGGRLLAVDQSGYAPFLGSIIPPRQEQQIDLYGPPLDVLTSDKGTIGVFLYDVVTGQDQAGAVTEKQNFEWYFDYELQPRSQAVQTRTTEGWLSHQGYMAAVQQENAEKAQSQRQQLMQMQPQSYPQQPLYAVPR